MNFVVVAATSKERNYKTMIKNYFKKWSVIIILYTGLVLSRVIFTCKLFRPVLNLLKYNCVTSMFKKKSPAVLNSPKDDEAKGGKNKTR